LCSSVLLQAETVDPFAVNNGVIPSASEYKGPLFKFSYNYPTMYAQPKETPWGKVLKGKPLTKANAHAYGRA